MDLKKIEEVLQAPVDDKMKRAAILETIAMDKDAIKDVLEMLQEERSKNNEMIIEMNLNLSRAHIFIEEYTPEVVKLKKDEKPKTFDKYFVIDRISEFYIQYKNYINHCFNRFN